MSPSLTPWHAIHPINRAPKHVIQKILRYISDDARSDLSQEVPYIDCTALSDDAISSPIQVTHVCRRFRLEALDYGYFWSYVHVGHFPVKQVVAYLERSKGASLDVELSCTVENIEDMKRSIGYLCDHGHRIRNLLVKLVFFEYTDVLLPLLERLRDVVSLRILSFPQKVILNHSVSFNHLHFLRSLQLCCVLPVPEMHYYFANVTSLRLQWSDYDACPSWDEFVGLILSLPILRVLAIMDYEWNPRPAVENTIALPCLELIELSLTEEACRQILGAFDLSTTSQISIFCKNYHVSDPVIVPLHLSNEVARCSDLQITSTSDSISFSAVLDQFDVSQQLNITLALVNTKGEPKRTWIDKIIKRWLKASPFKSARYAIITASGTVSLVDNLDDDHIEATELDGDITEEVLI